MPGDASLADALRNAVQMIGWRCDPIRIHLGMAKTYRARIGQLIAGPSEDERMGKVKGALLPLSCPPVVPRS